MVFRYGNKEDCLSHPILDVQRCIFTMPGIFNKVLNNDYDHSTQLFVSGTTFSGEKVYGKIELRIERDCIKPVSNKWVYYKVKEMDIFMKSMVQKYYKMRSYKN